ncbi:MAG: hypothetical protein EOM21_20880 [Gammaproteobacteria bacterium]|nr:hypothetical protein [Gammaproteobacteria bacterium]
MLNQVPATINRLASRIVHNHPNSIAMQAFRKVVLRTPAETLGGLGVLSSEDEDAIEYVFLGTGSALPTAEDAMSPSALNDNADVTHSDSADLRFMFAPDLDEDAPAWEPEKSDVIVLWLDEAGALKVPLEIVGLESVNNIPPFSVRYICNRRDDLLWAVNDLDDPPEEVSGDLAD